MTPSVSLTFASARPDLLPEHVWNYVEGGAGDEHTRGTQRLLMAGRSSCCPEFSWTHPTIDTRTQILGHRPRPPHTACANSQPSDVPPGCRTGDSQKGPVAPRRLAVMSTLGSTPVQELGRGGARAVVVSALRAARPRVHSGPGAACGRCRRVSAGPYGRHASAGRAGQRPA